MPVLNSARHLKRDDNSGRNFSIIFAVIAFVLIAACLFWGLCLPRYRKKHPRRPSPTRYNGLHQAQAFPSHPALLRGFRKNSTGHLRKYNPRTQTPFPNTPPPGAPVSLPSLTPCNRSAQNIGSPDTDGDIFSPARDRLPSRRGFPPNGTLQSKPSKDCLQIDLSTEDYILPVLEPMALCPKSAGKAPTLARHLNSFPMPRSVSAASGKLAHPRKLFDDLEQRYSKTTTITSFETPSPTPLNTQRQNELLGEEADHNKSLSAPDPLPDPTISCSRLHKGRCYDDKSGTMSSNKSGFEKRGYITRAGTVIRPKTPVAEIRDRYDRYGTSAMAREESSPKAATVSSIDLPTNSTFSSYLRSGTPPTSPMEQPKMSKIAVVTAQNREQPSIIPATRNPLTSTGLPTSDRLGAIPEGQRDESRLGKIFKANKTLIRPRPVRLNLTFNAKSSAVKNIAQRHSMSSLGSLLIPLGKAKRPSIQSSSVYSRDTRGVSILRSPISPAFGDRPSTNPDRDDAGARIWTRKASSLDLLRSKIDNWDLHTAHLDFPTSPSSTLKRALSDLGPRSPVFPSPRPASFDCTGEGSSHQKFQRLVPKICIGRPSDDIFRDPAPELETGKVLKRVLDMEVAASLASLTRSLSRGSAPGGADWI